MEPEVIRVIVQCPHCDAEQEDLDGFGFIYCPSCGHCTHPSAEGEDDSSLLWCTVCGVCINV